jgi:hypothetical protein
MTSIAFASPTIEQVSGVDPLEPPMPGNVSLEHAVHFAEALVRGQKDRWQKINFNKGKRGFYGWKKIQRNRGNDDYRRRDNRGIVPQTACEPLEVRPEKVPEVY